MNIYSRGSEWRRWDLHVHTPCTQKNDKYVGVDESDKWNNFYNAVNDYIGDGKDPLRRIAVIGITDYLSVENYKKVIQDDQLPATVDFVLPNVELRICPISRKGPTNIHCIFNPEYVDKLESRFFNNLHVSYNGAKYSALESSLIDFGRAFSCDAKLPAKEAYAVGVEQFVIPFEELKRVFEGDSELRENTIVILPNSNQDGASGVAKNEAYMLESGSQLDATRRALYQFADMIFSGNPKDASYFVGNACDDKDTIIRQYGSLKPCVHGSDAHSIDKLFEPDCNRYCWIKSDPTFNGLKQVIYEPDTRVCINPVLPEVKPDYQVIDCISFNDSRVQTEPIVFNDKLTCIIGGKSTGKSLLLHNLAKCIDSNQVNEKLKLTRSDNSDGRMLENAVVRWRDGVCSNDENVESRKIVYIPQTYLNRLSDENEELTEIDEIIKSIVLMNPEATHADEKMQHLLTVRKNSVDKKIYEIVHQSKSINLKKTQMSEIGSRKAIEAELEKLNKQKEKLSKASSISDEEIALYNDAVNHKMENDSLIQKLEEDREHLNGLDSVVVSASILHTYEGELSKRIDNSIASIIASSDQLWQIERARLIGYIEQRLIDLRADNNEYSSAIESLKVKMESNDAIRQLSESIQGEQEKLNKVEILENEIDRMVLRLDKNIEELVDSFLKYRIIRCEYAETINGLSSVSQDGLEFSVETPVRTDAFIATLNEIANNASLKSNRDIINTDSLDWHWFVRDNVSNLIRACLEEKIRFKDKRTPEQGLRILLSDWNNTTYRVKMDGDEINYMSPGKKALVLLKLLINLAESRCPILIDQPEDDLDNRSIFNELIPFIKEKKIQRQIIVVTHNANVVIGGDAEEIIIANQNGKDSPNEDYRFEYRSGSIEENRPIEGRSGILNERGIQQHICDILEGGEKAFDLRKNKYHITNRN